MNLLLLILLAVGGGRAAVYNRGYDNELVRAVGPGRGAFPATFARFDL